MNILLIGDIFGKGGRKAVRHLLPRIVDRESVDLTIANVENASRGLGVSQDAAEELKKAGIQVMTSGNHVWKRPGAAELLEEEPFLVRPANYPPNVPGKGSVVWESNLGVPVGILNLMGRVFMDPLECPFRTGEEHIERLAGQGVRIIVLDFHAEATSEKLALAWHLDGKVSAIVGTHTHVQTADERVLPQGTGYITDAGMTGGAGFGYRRKAPAGDRELSHRGPSEARSVPEGPCPERGRDGDFRKIGQMQEHPQGERAPGYLRET